MKIVLLLLAAAIVGWAWKTRGPRAIRLGDVAAVVGALISFRMLSKGQAPIGVAGLAGAGYWLWLRIGAGKASGGMSEREALGLLDLPAGADRAMVQDAHRRLIVRVHPDAGGSPELARRVNIARDTLLARSERPRT